MTKTKTVVGIDPGLANSGWAVVCRNPRGFTVQDCGCIRTNPKSRAGSRLGIIYNQIVDVLHVHMPNTVSIELVFHNKNVSSSLKTANAIGVVLLACEHAGVDVMMITPQQAKASVSGHGSLDKKQVQIYVEKLTGQQIKNSHAADAVAIAIACLLKSRCRASL